MSHEDILAAMVDRDAEPVNVEPSFTNQVCCISIHIPNRVLFLNCPGQLYTFLHSALRTSYRLGIDKEQGQQWITLHGTPFMSPGPGQHAGPQIYCALIACMMKCGWQLVTASTISLRVTDVHSMFFEKAKLATTSGERLAICALTFIGMNIIELTDAPLHLVELLRTALNSHWKQGERNAVTSKLQSGAPQFQLSGRPWDAVGPADLIATRILIAQLLSKLKGAGYTVLLSCPTKITNAGMRPEELDSWIIQCPDTESTAAAADAQLGYETFKD